MGNKAVVVTGATSGIGFETARKLAAEGFTVIGVGRKEERCMDAMGKILLETPNADVRFITADLLHQDEVVRIASQIGKVIETEYDGKLSALINNAGSVYSHYATTEDGIERQFALNYLSAFLLTNKLLPYLVEASGRVIITGSGSHKGTKIRWNDVMLTKGYNPLSAYKQSKLCDMLLAKGLNDRHAGKGIRAYVVDPGLVKTDIGTKAGGMVKLVWAFRKPFGVSPAAPAETYVWICRQEDHPGHLCYHDCMPRKFSREVTSRNAERLFELSHRLCGTEEFGLKT